MASGDSDHIEVMDSSIVKKTEIATDQSGLEDDDHDRISEKNVPYDPAVGPLGAISKVHKSDRKIGHRRVGEGGEITYKKIQSSQIMGSIQLGIQHAIGGLASKPERDLLMQDFMTVETTNFPHEGSNHTPAHHYSEFKFKTYAPIAFRYFRDLFGIQPDDFLMSMCSAPLRELSNPGASGSIFYLTNDDEFIIKTVQHKEGEFLQKLLPGYYLNLDQNPRTLLPKFFGLYCYQCNSKNVRLVAMNNLLPSSVKLHQKYDLKGSTYKRKANKSERQKRSPTYKDLDFMEHHTEGIFLEADTYNALIKTMQRDCRVLESFKIMDYSLLVGIHNLDEAQREKTEERNRTESGQSDDEDGEPKKSGLNRTRSEQRKEDFRTQVKRTQSINRQRLVAHSTAMESIQAESEPIDEEEDVPPGGIPARNARGERLLLFLGIIDILQSYRLRKKLEHTWKSMIHDGDTVSVHRPSFYAQRFLDFMGKTVFKKIPSSLKHSPSKRKSIAKPSTRPTEEIDNTAATTSSSAPAKAVSLTDVTAQITPTSVTTPVSTAAKVSQATAKTTPSEPDVAFPAVLKGSQKQRVPPPVPPRGSPKTKRGGAHSQASSHDTKGDYQNLFFTVNDLPQPYFMSDDEFYYYGHGLKYDSVACPTPPSISAHPHQMSKLEASNSFLGYVQEGDILKEIPTKGLVAQSNMMANFNINDAVRDHLDTGEYDGDSFTDSSSDEFVVVHEIKEDNKVVVNTTTISLLKPTRQDTFQTEDSQSLDTLDSPKMKLNVPKPPPIPKSAPKSQGLMSRINTLKRNLSKKETTDESEKPVERNNTKGGLISGLTKKFIFNQSKKDRSTKTTPKIEIKPYTEEHCVEEVKKEQEVCQMKARSNIDLFQRQIYKTQSETEINSVISSRESLNMKRNVENRQFVNERKKMFETSPQSQATNNRIPKRPVPSRKGRASPPPPPRVTSQAQPLVSERISKFTVTRVPEPNAPIRTPRAGIKENRASFKRKLDTRKIYVMQKEFEEIL